LTPFSARLWFCAPLAFSAAAALPASGWLPSSPYLNHFGHTIYDLDFAKSVPADDPAPLLEAFKVSFRLPCVNQKQ